MTGDTPLLLYAPGQVMDSTRTHVSDDGDDTMLARTVDGAFQHQIVIWCL